MNRHVALLTTLAAAVFVVVLAAWQTLAADGLEPLGLVVGGVVFWGVFYLAYGFVRRTT